VNVQIIIGDHERAAYIIEHHANCVFITGTVPAAAFPVLSKLAPEGSVMDPDVARICGVTFALGLPEDLAELRKAGAASAETRERINNPGLSEAATKWLASGKRGVSSEAIFTHLTGVKCSRDSGFEAIPYDPSDFRRCQLLLEQVPELQPLFHRMAEVSPKWAALVKAWPGIIAALDREAPGWRDGRAGGSAPTAYELIQRAIGR
jgi:hypothetical protein